MSANLDGSELPIVPASVVGLLSWVIGYGFTYVLVAADVRESSLNQFAQAFGNGDAGYELVGWVFFNAHFVDAVVDAGFFGARRANFVGGEDGFTPLLYAIPVVLLVTAGLAVGRYRGVTGTNEGAITGVLVLPAYFVLCIVGVFLFRVDVAGISGEPDLLAALLVAGLVYPLVFGGIGGVVAAVTADADTAGRTAS